MNKVKIKIQEIIFEADTPMGKLFDIALLVMILLSVIVVMLESVESYRNEWSWLFEILEWIFTFLFSLEYLLRIFSVKKPFKYIFSFYGIIDLLSLIPSYIGIGIGTNNISSIKKGISAVKNDISAVTNYISAVKSDISAVKNYIYAVKNYIYAVKNDISAVKNEMTFLP